jgi:hypothetical protein
MRGKLPNHLFWSVVLQIRLFIMNHHTSLTRSTDFLSEQFCPFLISAYVIWDASSNFSPASGSGGADFRISGLPSGELSGL